MELILTQYVDISGYLASVRYCHNSYSHAAVTGTRMDTIGTKMGLLVIGVVVVSTVGMTGATSYYQEQMEQANEAIDERDERIERLETELNETQDELERARLELDELRGIEQEVTGLEARNEDLRSLLTGKVSGAEEAERRRRTAVDELEETREEMSELEDRFDTATEEYGELRSDYERMYEACEASEGCSAPSETTAPDNYSSSGDF